MPNYIGVCHVHSMHSSDAVLSIQQLAHFFRDRQYHFVCLTDHSPRHNGSFIDEKEMSAIVQECEEASDGTFLMAPGLECSTEDNAHILAIGITRPIFSHNWETIVHEIHAQGGVAILAHPFFFERTYSLNHLEMLDGIEVWNANKSVKFPDIAASLKIKKFRKLGKSLSGIFGLDFHKPGHFKRLTIIIHEDELSIKSVVQALKTGSYLLRSERFETSSSADFPIIFNWLWYCQGWLFFKSRTLAKGIQFQLDNLGIKIPEPFLKVMRKFYFR